MIVRTIVKEIEDLERLRVNVEKTFTVSGNYDWWEFLVSIDQMLIVLKKDAFKKEGWYIV